MEEAGTSELEDRIRRHCESGELERGATVAIEAYGSELLGYLHAMAPSPADADEMFSELCERLWKHLPDFRWESSVRTWAYVVARNLLRSGFRSAQGPRGRVKPLAASQISKLADSVRSTTPPHMKTESKNKLRQIRDALEPDDRTLLILRVDRRLAWRDIAAVMADDDASKADLTRHAASLRKRFERLKERLRKEMAAYGQD